MKLIREGRMGPPKACKTGCVVGTYPKPMLVFVFDEEGLSVIPQRGTKVPAGYVEFDCLYEDIVRVKPDEVASYLTKDPKDLPKIMAVDFCDTIDKQMTLVTTPVVPNDVPFTKFAGMLNALAAHSFAGKDLPWKTVVLDPLTRFNDIVFSFVAMKAPDTIKDNRLSYPLVSAKIMQFVGVLTSLRAHVVCIMHVQADRDEKLGNVLETPMFFGGYRQKIQSQFTAFFYAVIEGGKPVVRTRNYSYARGIGATFPVGLPDPCPADFKSIYGTEITK